MRATSETQESVVEWPTQEDELPEGWSLARIPDFVADQGMFCDGDWVETKDQDPNGDVRLIQLADIGDGIFKNKSNRFLSSAKAVQLDCTFLQPEDVLIARLPEPLGRACIFPGDPKKSVTAVDVCIVRPGNSGCDPHWIMHTINAPQVRAKFQDFEKGTTRGRISRRNLAAVSLPVPPLAEQKRIAEKVEQLLARVNAARERLARVSAILKRFRQAVLAAACSGRLTEDWREIKSELEPGSQLLARILHSRRLSWEIEELAKFEERGRPPTSQKWKSKYKEPLTPDGEELDDLPSGWEWATVGQLYEVKYGLSEPLRKTLPDSKLDLPVISMANITENGTLNLEGLRYFPVRPEMCRRLLLKRGDLLFNWRNAPKWIGKTAVFDLPGEYVNASFLLRLRPPLPEDDGRFSWRYLNHLRVTGHFEFASRAAVNQSNFNASEVSAIPIPVPPLAEQHEIVRRVGALLIFADAIEKRVRGVSNRVEKLTQAIRAKAFRGELVPIEAELARREGRSYEPASALLAHIQATRPMRGQSERTAKELKLPRGQERDDIGKKRA